MNIHHATKKKADKEGVKLEAIGPGEQEAHVIASIEKDGIAFYDVSAKKALGYVLEARDELSKGLYLVTQEGFEQDYIAYKAGTDEIVARDPDLFDLYTTLDGEEPGEVAVEDEGDEEEQEAGGSVVPSRYKEMYAERGDPTTCGDWLALTLNKYCHVTKENGKKGTDIDVFMDIAKANQIDPDYLAKLSMNQTRGWEGRMRMSTRNKLVAVAIEQKGINIPKAIAKSQKSGKEFEPAAKGWMDEHQAKAEARQKAKEEKKLAKKLAKAGVA